MFNRLIKPSWGKPLLSSGEPNPEFKQEIIGLDVYEGCFDDTYLAQKNEEGYNIYYFPNHPTSNVYELKGKHFLSGKDIDTFNYVFVDMDLKDKVYESKDAFFDKLNQFTIKPTFVLDSGNGVHAYWKIRDLTRDQYVITQLALINYFKTDESIWTVLQLMRVPNTFNTKIHGNFKLTKIITELSSDLDYSLEDFPESIFELSEKIILKADNHLARLDGRMESNLPQNINIDELPEAFIDFMYEPKNESIKNLFENPTKFYKDRSAADMKLANILFTKDFDKRAALAVLANTQKALGKGANRFSYAAGTVDKVYVDRSKHNFLTVFQKINLPTPPRIGTPIRGPYFLDCLGEPWRKKQVMGVIAGPGVGKTAFSLKILKEIIENNPSKDDFFVFFSLEMPESDIIKRWIRLVGDNSPLTNRLYVISNEDEQGEPRNIGIQEVHEFVTEIKKQTGKSCACTIVDHIGILSTMVSLKKGYSFGVESDQKSGYGDIRTLTMNALATQMKTLAKMLDTFLIVLTQTTKDKGAGDIAIDKNGAYNISQYENIMDYIVTLWQPLMRIQGLTEHYFLAWQYAKIREKSTNDMVITYQPKLLTYNMSTGDLTPPNAAEFEIFEALLPRAKEVREAMKKKDVNEYTKSPSKEDLQNKLKK